jgi:hypothetical protein
MPPATDRMLSFMERRLATGPIVIGENHTFLHARAAIRTLIDRHAVNYLSIELPIAPPNRSRADGELDIRPRGVNNPAQIEADYFSRVTELHNPYISLRLLSTYAAQRHIPVYLHDMPANTSPIHALDPTSREHANQFSPMPRLERKLVSMVRQRNVFMRQFLHAKIGAGVRVLMGMVILAGDHHTIAQQCGGANFTIQGLLGIPDNRVYHLS